MEQAVDDYFSSLNYLCRGIITEKANFTSLLGGQWESLPQDEQDALLDEHFIAPHIRQKYGETEDNDLPSMFPVLKIKSGQKRVEEDEVSLKKYNNCNNFLIDSWKVKKYVSSSDSNFFLLRNVISSLSSNISDNSAVIVIAK